MKSNPWTQGQRSVRWMKSHWILFYWTSTKKRIWHLNSTSMIRFLGANCFSFLLFSFFFLISFLSFATIFQQHLLVIKTYQEVQLRNICEKRDKNCQSTRSNDPDSQSDPQRHFPRESLQNCSDNRFLSEVFHLSFFFQVFRLQYWLLPFFQHEFQRKQVGINCCHCKWTFLKRGQMGKKKKIILSPI